MSDNIVKYTGLDDALIGYVTRPGMEPCAVYDPKKCVRALMSGDGMTKEEAYDFFHYNIESAWVGDRTPFMFTKEEP